MKITIKNKKIFFISSVIGIILIALIITTSIIFGEANSIVKATRNYNAAVRIYNEVSSEYDSLLTNCCIDNIQGMPTSFGTLREESESFTDCLPLIFSNNNSIKIDADTNTIHSLSQSITDYISIVNQITSPSDSWVKEKLSKVEGINGIGVVTEINDPDGLLNKDGGYIGCIYFSHIDISPDSVDDIIEIGTDAGGAVEIYSNVSDALARCDYLSQFDGTVLYSGSYAIVGTMIIRTSYAFSDTEQFLLTDNITKSFTTIE